MIIEDLDIRSIYNNALVEYEVELRSHCGEDPENVKHTSIVLKSESGNNITVAPIKRDYFMRKALVNKTGIGKVAEHIWFFLEEDYRNKKIAKLIHEQELIVYKRKEFDQIQLSAIGQGILAWKKLFYKYKDPSDEKMVLQEAWNYLRQVHGMSIEEIEKKYKDKSLEYILNTRIIKKPTGDKISFFEWYRTKEHTIGIDMYKDIE